MQVTQPVLELNLYCFFSLALSFGKLSLRKFSFSLHNMQPASKSPGGKNPAGSRALERKISDSESPPGHSRNKSVSQTFAIFFVLFLLSSHLAMF